MLVTMLSDHEDSLNGGRTIQRFESGKIYDVPDQIGLSWIAAGAAQAVGAVLRDGPGRTRRPAPTSDAKKET